MEQQTLFKVRDLRKKDQFKIDDIYLNGYARVCGANATLAYLSLCRHAEFNSQKAFPSQDKIGFELGISVASVKRGIKTLSEYNIVKIDKEKMCGKFSNNVYYLIDKSEWKPAIAPQELRKKEAHHSSKTVAHQPPTVRDTLKDNKVLRITNTKDNKDIMLAKPTDWLLEEKLNDYLKDKRRHIQVIALWIKENELKPENEGQLQSIIHRFSRPAKLLASYSNEDIMATIQVMKNTDYLKKFTPETALKYIDFVVSQKKKAGPKIARFEEVTAYDGRKVMRVIYEKGT